MQGVLVNSSKTQEKSSSAVGWESTKQWNNRVVSKWKKKKKRNTPGLYFFARNFQRGSQKTKGLDAFGNSSHDFKKKKTKVENYHKNILSSFLPQHELF